MLRIFVLYKKRRFFTAHALYDKPVLVFLWRNKMWFSRKALHGTVAALALFVAATPAFSADITAEQTALAYDLLNPLTPSAPPPGTDPAIFKKAVTIVQEEHLAGQGARPNFTEPGILERYGKALFLGARTKEFAADIGLIRDLVDKGNRPELEEALRKLWVKAGRTSPDAKTLDPVIQSLYGAKGAEPVETVRHVIDKPDHRVEITHARAGGKMQVDVITKNPDGTDRDRTSFQGVTETTPTPDGRELQRHIKLDQVCTNTPETDAATAERLNGDWTSNTGTKWTIANSGGQITLEEKKPERPLTYTGTYRLGKISAAHAITNAADMGEDLPSTIREQLAGMGISFRVYLESCANRASRLNGTWSSQHVTYSGMTMSVERIHDPYDLTLNLVRPGVEKVAEGASQGEIP